MDSTTKGLRTTGAELSPLRSELALKPRLTRRVARARVRGGAGRFHDPPQRKPVGAAPWEALQILASVGPCPFSWHCSPRAPASGVFSPPMERTKAFSA